MGKPVTEIPTTAHLMGPWIQYNNNLGNGLNEYSVTVKQEKVFNAFTIRPKICTDLSQCFDVNAIGVKADTSGLTRVYTFNFDALEDRITRNRDTDFVKLVFFVDYFRPENFKPEENITFDLKLLNFGDPMYARTVNEWLKCDKTGTDFTYKSNPTMDNPNYCVCNDGYYGPKCEQQAAKPTELKVDPPVKENWDEMASPKPGYIPTKKGNQLTFNFKNINTDMFDICSTIEYNVRNPSALMKLTVQYSEGSASPDTPVDTSTYIDEVLKKTPEKGNAFTFCVSDLRIKPQKTFYIVITAESTAPDQIYNADTLIITKFTATLIPINRPRFIQNVDIKHKQYWTQQKWHTMSVENNFIPSKNKTSHQLKVTVLKTETQPIVSYFISDWIIVSDVKEFKPTISFKLGDKYTNLKIEHSVMVETNKQIPAQFLEMTYDKMQTTFTDQEIAAIIPNTAQQIKLFLKFTLTADTNKDTYFDVTINSVSVFNPCPTDSKKGCSSKGTCTFTDNASIFQCKCTGAQGRNCEKNKQNNLSFMKMCNSYPMIPTLNAKNPFDRPNCERIATN
ncbi:unnamed protein product [Medioppia subpectinata]|uniref:EGF-like domain-containing protein n=1 Tax=Medioppia subpectinata TaxID=1979941 RepID=A0A7R9KJL1_9ACAR|nr:unnamed protein product [Medioppia subpectinata]CAG2104597.1 unnamed protein product [Medioppia subpectinata]